MYRLGTTSKKRLEGVHPDLVRVVKRAIQITDQDFSVLEGLRTKERQKQLYRQGKTTTMNSRHLTGHAVDLGPYPWGADLDGDGTHNGADWDSYYPIAAAMKLAAQELDIVVEWGGDWKSFKDGPHWQLPWSLYPKE